jgi:NAD(P)-dependent dehydrogenase (short-subunit alcohol dehydrogenase family)
VTLRPDVTSLTGTVAVVTGGGAGLGRGIAAGLAAFGAEVAVWERDPATCAEAAAEVGGLASPPTCATPSRSNGRWRRRSTATAASTRW